MTRTRSHGLLLLCASTLLAALTLQSASSAPDADAAKDRRLYQRHCGACHGTYGTGNGPVAPFLKARPADLTRLFERYGSPLDREAVAQFIDGRRDVLAHGPREMPVWGERFYPGAEDDREVERFRREIIARIVNHLASIQGKLEL